MDKIIVGTIRGTLKPRLGFLRGFGVVPPVPGALAFQPRLYGDEGAVRGYTEGGVHRYQQSVRGYWSGDVLLGFYTTHMETSPSVSSGIVPHEPP